MIKEKNYKAKILTAKKEAEDTTKKGKKTIKEKEDICQSIQPLRTKISNVTNERNHMVSQ